VPGWRFHCVGSAPLRHGSFAPRGLCLWWGRPVFLEFVAFGTYAVDVGEHSFQQSFGRGRGFAGPLKPDFAALPVNLGAHPLDFGSELVKLHGVLSYYCFLGLRLFIFSSSEAQKATTFPQPYIGHWFLPSAPSIQSRWPTFHFGRLAPQRRGVN
jgi:hypothetical protein